MKISNIAHPQRFAGTNVVSLTICDAFERVNEKYIKNFSYQIIFINDKKFILRRNDLEE
jgi:hypothetical protein